VSRQVGDAARLAPVTAPPPPSAAARLLYAIDTSESSVVSFYFR